MPGPRDIVFCRHRQWLVDEVTLPVSDDEATRVRMVFLDDDNSGRVLEVLWKLRLGAKVDLSQLGHGV